MQRFVAHCKQRNLLCGASPLAQLRDLRQNLCASIVVQERMLKETNQLSALLLQCDTFEEELFQAQIDSGVDVDALLSQSVPQALAAAKVGHIASHHIFNPHVLHQFFKISHSDCNSLSFFRRACSSAAPNCSTSSSDSTIPNPPPPIQHSLWTLPSLACQHHAHHHVRPCASHNSSPQAAVVWLPVSQRAGLHQRRPRSALKPTPALIPPL
jgi:hypothetical protein